jgi:hypothetical protein
MLLNLCQDGSGAVKPLQNRFLECCSLFGVDRVTAVDFVQED